MNSLSIRITFRVAAMILLAFAVVRFWSDYFSSLRTQEEAIAGGFAIDHTFAINYLTIILGVAGILLFAFSFFFPRKRI